MISVRTVLQIIDDVGGLAEPSAEVERFVEEIRRRVLLADRPVRFSDASARLGDLLAERERTRDSIGCVCREVGATACPIHKSRS